MPATESTWRDQKRLHFLFGVSGLALLLATLWMFAADHDRSWKYFQKTARNVDVQMTEWRKLQFENDAYQRELTRLEESLSVARSQPLPAGTMESFLGELRQEAERRAEPAPNLERLETLAAEVATTATAAEQARQAALAAEVEVDKLRTQLEEAQSKVKQLKDGAPEEATRLADEVANFEQLLAEARTRAETAAAAEAAAAAQAAAPRARLIDGMNGYLQEAKFREDTLLVERKFKNAEYDKVRADLDLAVRDSLPQPELDAQQEIVDQLTSQVADLTLHYQAASQHRKDLQKIIDDLTAAEVEAAKKLADHKAERERIDTAARERESNFLVGFLPGKKWLELPILDAFNSPLKIENLWSDGLEQNYNFRNVRRFDRCTTCHKAIEKTLPGSATDGAYEHAESIVFTLDTTNGAGAPTVPTSDTGSSAAEASQTERLESRFGLRLADEGLIEANDVTVSFVVPQSLAAQAQVAAKADVPILEPLAVREIALMPTPVTGSNLLPGLLAGDVIKEINGDRVKSAERAGYFLLAAADRGETVQLTVQRGLPHPYASHPRLDLFVGSMSPHTMADFACTICHEGQGSATDFKWASHSPNSPRQRREWAEEHGWFDNHHWIYPMNAQRFLESSCLKCHHQVTELSPSERFPEPPAPKLMQGHQLILKYGCYGCHEINGYDGQRRVGPDLRLEPNFFAAAQQLKADKASFAAMDAEEQAQVETLIEHPERDDVRRKLYQMLTEDQQADQPRFNPTTRSYIAPILKDIESPGELRKSGPSLRFARHKLDNAFMYDWIREPKHFRPSTRMPQFFGLWDHLTDEKSLHTAQKFEPAEILGVVHYLQSRSQDFEYLAPAEDVSHEALEEKINRGRVAFEQRGCLACHSHADFPDLAKFRPADQIQQAPDLTFLGSKFDPQRNPNGRAWLYSWIKQPNRYHVRTVMPDLYLDPVTTTDAEGNVKTVDPADDITEYLLASRSDWQPAPGTLTGITDESRGAVDELALEHLKDAFFVSAAEKYLAKGIPADMAAELTGAEKELVVPVEQYEDPNAQLSDDQKLAYIGRKTIGKYGCYACHDIPGFEDAKPIGTALADWGRKDPARLAFEHISHYIEHGHGAASHEHATSPGHAAEEHPAGEDSEAHAEPSAEHAHDASAKSELPEFYKEQLMSGNRIGFLYQKLREPRSYDYHKTVNKKYNERLRMPQFPFDAADREAVVTFVLGLVAEPPNAKYVYKPDARSKALLEGRQVLEKYNCGGCHVLEGERWHLAYKPGTFGTPPVLDTFDLTLHRASLEELAASAQPDHRDLLHAIVEGLPAIDDADGLPQVIDIEGEPLYEDDTYSPLNVAFGFKLFKPALLDGQVFQVQQGGLQIMGSDISKRYPANGGDLTKYLLPRVVEREKIAIPTLKGGEAWGWLPPPLIGEGTKVQTEWLHNFLLDPYPIRPATVLRMPRFNMSPEEATKLVNYFAARDDAEFPYAFTNEKRSDHLAEKNAEYQTLLQQVAPEDTGTRLEHALRIVINKQYCVQCHIVGDFVPTKEERGKGPDLTRIYQRLRPDYLRQWIARPTSILPYTGMPVNIPYKAGEPFDGTTVPQSLYHGNSLDQVQALVDLLSNYDRFAAGQSKLKPLVDAQPNPTTDPAAGAATGGN